MNCSTLPTTIQRLAALAVIGLALLLQGCRVCGGALDTCFKLMGESGIYRVRFHRMSDGLDLIVDAQTDLGGTLQVCDCSEILDATLILRNLPPDCSPASANVHTLWPPNQHFVNIPIEGVTDPEGDPVGISIGLIETDELQWDVFPGDQELEPDFRTTSPSTAEVRAERDPAGNGRVYRINFTASDRQGATCRGQARACVPLSSGGTCVDDANLCNLYITRSDAPDPVNQGDLLTYTINITISQLDVRASNVILTDTLPPNSIFVSAEIDGNSQRCAESLGVVTCSVGDIPRGTGIRTAKITVRPTTAGMITNTASVRALEKDFDLNDNTLIQTTTVNPPAAGADASVSIAAAPNPIRSGNELTFTIVVQNTGPQAATEVGLTGFSFAALEGRNFTTTQGTCSLAESTNLTCNIGTLANGASATVTIRARAFQSGTLTKTVTVTSNNDRNSANNTASVNVTVNPP